MNLSRIDYNLVYDSLTSVGQLDNSGVLYTKPNYVLLSDDLIFDNQNKLLNKRSLTLDILKLFDFNVKANLLNRPLNSKLDSLFSNNSEYPSMLKTYSNSIEQENNNNNSLLITSRDFINFKNDEFCLKSQENFLNYIHNHNKPNTPPDVDFTLVLVSTFYNTLHNNKYIEFSGVPNYQFPFIISGNPDKLNSINIYNGNLYTIPIELGKPMVLIIRIYNNSSLYSLIDIFLNHKLIYHGTNENNQDFNGLGGQLLINQDNNYSWDFYSLTAYKIALSVDECFSKMKFIEYESLLKFEEPECLIAFFDTKNIKNLSTNPLNNNTLTVKNETNLLDISLKSNIVISGGNVLNNPNYQNGLTIYGDINDLLFIRDLENLKITTPLTIQLEFQLEQMFNEEANFMQIIFTDQTNIELAITQLSTTSFQGIIKNTMNNVSSSMFNILPNEMYILSIRLDSKICSIDLSSQFAESVSFFTLNQKVLKEVLFGRIKSKINGLKIFNK